MEDIDLEPIVTLDLRSLRTTLEEQDGDLILLVDDGDIQIEFSSGLNGTWQQAIEGTERLMEALTEFTATLRRMRVAHAA